MDIAVLALLLSWPPLLFKLFKCRGKSILVHGYLSITLALVVSLLYAFTFFQSYVECMKASHLSKCSIFPNDLIEWYGEWSLVFNIVFLAVLVCHFNYVQLTKINGVR